MKLESENVSIAPFAQPLNVVTIALATTFTGGGDSGKMRCYSQYEVRFKGTDPEVSMPIIKEGTFDLSDDIPPELESGLLDWFGDMNPKLLKRLAPKDNQP